jgi:hypothetical protein
MPTSKRRRATGQRRSATARREQQHVEKKRAEKKLSPRRYALRRALGWSLVGLAVVMGVVHLMTHLDVWDFAQQGVEDLLFGYPMAAALGIAGAVVLSR